MHNYTGSGNVMDKIEYFVPKLSVFVNDMDTTAPNLHDLKSVGAIVTNLIDFHGELAEFTWSVISSSSDDMNNSSGITKTYLAMLKFYEQHPTNHNVHIPIVVAMSSTYPAISLFRRMLVRFKTNFATQSASYMRNGVYDMLNRVPGPTNTLTTVSFPFLKGQPLSFISAPASTTLPQLPHGSIILSAINAVKAEHFKTLLAAVLTESKIVLVSKDICLTSVVSEVLSTLIWPFVFTFPIIPQLPLEMNELISAPVPFVIGVDVVERVGEGGGEDDIVVYDLDRNVFLSETTNIEMPSVLNDAVGRALETFVSAESAAESGSKRGVEFNAKESKNERRFRVEICVALTMFVRGIETRLQAKTPMGGGSGGGIDLGVNADDFTPAFVLTQMFHHFVDTITAPHQRFFHDLMDLIDMSSQEAPDDEATARIVMAAMKIAEAQEKGGRVFTLPPSAAVTAQEAQGEETAGGFAWLRNAESHADEYDLALAAAEEAKNIIVNRLKIPKSPVKRGESEGNIGEGLAEVRIGEYSVADLMQGVEGGGREADVFEDVARMMQSVEAEIEDEEGSERESTSDVSTLEVVDL
jgi:hypothetical protein